MKKAADRRNKGEAAFYKVEKETFNTVVKGLANNKNYTVGFDYMTGKYNIKKIN